MYQKYPFLLAGLCLIVWFLTACTADQEKQQAIGIYASLETFPKLLDRPERIQMGKEWEHVQSYYVKNRDLILRAGLNQEASIQLAHLFIQEARVTGEHGHYYPAALQLLEAYLEQPQEDSDRHFRALSAKAIVELAQHEFQSALQTAEAAVRLNPYNAQVYGALVDAHVELGNYDQAVAMADKMVAIRPDLRSYSRISYLREIHGQTDGAIDAMKMAVAAGAPGTEELAWTRLELGKLYQRYSQPEKAEWHFRAVLTERPDYPFALAALADLEMERGQTETAEQLLLDARSIIPEVGFYEQLAHLYGQTHRLEEKNVTEQAILQMLGEDVASGHNMNLEYADFYLNLAQQPEEALAYALREYELRPANIDVNHLLADIYLRMGERQQATAHLKRAMVTNSQQPELVQLAASL